MGQIQVNGLGIVNIAGVTPDERETQMILDAARNPANISPARAPSERAIAASLDAVRNPSNVLPPGTPERFLPKPPEPAVEGPLGLIPAEFRQKVRQEIEDLPALFGFLAEMSGSTGLGALGTGLGSLLPVPGGALFGGTAGSLIGEYISQEAGVSPASDVNLGLAAAGPVVGRGLAAVTRGTGRAVGKGVAALPPVKVARAKNILKSAGENIENLGASIFAAQRGLVSRTANELYDAARKAGVTISGDSLKATRSSIAELTEQMKPLSAIPEVQQAMKILSMTDDLLSGQKIVSKLTREQAAAFARGAPGIRRIGGGGNTQFVITEPIAFENLIQARQAVGVAVKRFRNAGGQKLGAAKKTFASLVTDLDNLAKGSPTLATARTARLAKAAVKRAKLEFAVRDLEGMVSRFTKEIPGEDGITINVKGLIERIRVATSPKHPRFDKNFTDALKDELPALKENLRAFAKVLEAGTPGGPGGLVIRGLSAKTGRAVVGGLAGFALGGPVSSGIGAMLGANGPEMMVAFFTTRAGTNLLSQVARAGNGEISQKAWLVLGQTLVRSLGEGRETAPVDETKSNR